MFKFSIFPQNKIKSLFLKQLNKKNFQYKILQAGKFSAVYIEEKPRHTESGAKFASNREKKFD